ncbi:MAG: hypothetical protein JW709_11255 [Sedimentisphaerales bacterium]|nr:hypothetical protein [Sedimentisphaerales bacterium]
MKRKWLLVEVMMLALPGFALGELRGDLNGDGRVDLLDLSILAEEWLMSDTYVQFDGSGRVTLPDNAALNPGTGDFSIALWINRAYRSGAQCVLSKYEATGNVLYEIITYQTGAVAVYLKNTSGTFFICFDVTLIENTWHHLAVTWDRDEPILGVKVYLDGLFVDGESPYGVDGDCSPSGVLTLGSGDDPSFSNGFIGAMDDIRIYRGRALSGPEVAALYNAGNGRKAADGDFTDGWYSNLDDGSGVTVSGRKIVGGAASDHDGTINSLDHVFWTAGGIPFLSEPEPSPPYLRDRWAGLIRSRY